MNDLEQTAIERFKAASAMDDLSEKTVDAVPVIRCFECKHAWIHPCGYVFCHRDGRSAYEMTFSLESFCSYGER